jgi:hypothetical protein
MSAVFEYYYLKSADTAPYRVYYDAQRELVSVEHDGAITWDELQTIKNDVWGKSACAIEIYPPQDRLVNNAPMRHLWLLGPNDWWPDLGHEGEVELKTLQSRFEAVVRAG